MFDLQSIFVFSKIESVSLEIWPGIPNFFESGYYVKGNKEAQREVHMANSRLSPQNTGDKAVAITDLY